MAPRADPATEATAPVEDERPTLRVFRRPTADRRVAITSSLRRGRAAARRGEHAEALAIFREGLTHEPDDPHLLCEAGWAAFQLGDPSAEGYLVRGTESRAAPPVLGACLYNLGRLHERAAEDGRGETRAQRLRAAATAYAESLAVRPGNAEVRRRLDAMIDAGSAPSFCPPAQAFPDVDALCAALEAWDPDAVDPECAPMERAVRVEGVGPPLATYVVTDDSLETYFLVAEVRGGLRAIAVLGNGWDRSCSWGAVDHVGARWWDEGPGRLEVVVHETGEYACAESPLDECLASVERGETEPERCDGLAESSVEVTDARHRLFCEDRAEPRCSILGPAPGTYRAWASPGPLPEGAAWRDALECPP